MNKQIHRRLLPEHPTKVKSIPEFLARIYAARGVVEERDLSLSLQGLLDTRQLKGVDQAVQLLVGAIYKRQKIIIIGDFDCDGATSTALAVHALGAMGAQNCQYLVPNRFEFGYGLTPEIVDLAATKSPDLIVTVDNGIASMEGVAHAKSLGIKVLVTDHHLPGDALPAADAIVNPNQPGCEFLSKNAAGVGVIFYVLSSLRSALRNDKWFEKQQISEPNMGSYLDLVALGTIADLVPLDKNNRILVEQGLKRIRAGRCRPGIRAILSLSQKSLSQVKASDMGFVVGPRLNAAGRLDDMSLGIECLLAEDESYARGLAARLDELNQERKHIEHDMKLDAELQLKNMRIYQQNFTEHDGQSDDSTMEWGVCLFEAHWHQGVIGILASRIKEKLHRPVIIFAPADDDPDAEGAMLKGSARSIPGFHMRDALDMIAKRHPDLLSKFGGHAMAAGMSIKKQDFEAFSVAFEQVVKGLLTKSDLQAVLYSDGELKSKELSLDNVSLLELAGPWGQQFPEPSFDGIFTVIQSRILKDKHLKLVLSPIGESQIFDAIEFNSEWVSQALPEEIRVLYRPNINEFRGKRNVQLMIDHLELL